MRYTVYVIGSAEGHRYTGMTEDMPVRLRQHNEHKVSFWTKRGTGWKILYTEEFASKVDASKRERWLKSGVGREFLKSKLTND